MYSYKNETHKRSPYRSRTSREIVSHSQSMYFRSHPFVCDGRRVHHRAAVVRIEISMGVPVVFPQFPHAIGMLSNLASAI